MERVISQEERIRRAEEVYRRRRNQGVRLTGSTVNISDKKDFSLFKNMIIKIVICSIIYVVFYTIKNSNYIFSQDVLNKTNEILSYDMNIQKIYEDGVKFLEKLNFSEEKDNYKEVENKLESEQEQDKEQDSKEKNENSISEDNRKKDEANNPEQIEGGVGGGNEIDANNVPELEQKSQMEQDAIYIRENCNMIIPVNGVVTSKFGAREPSELISGNHTGIDIGADEGTKIVSAIDGIVTEVSQEGDYGNHIKIVSGKITTLYAHCSKMYVNEGEEIKQGTEIAEIGSTGRATGPHLHFEVRVEDRLVDPEYVMQF